MRELKTIEVDKYVSSEKKGMVKHVGMISPQEAFDVLEKHLKEVDLIPDEYFLSNSYDWKGVKELPNYIRASCDVNWGGSEGIYLDIDLLYHDENKQLQRFHFATGKTLGCTGDDYLQMSRIAAECSLMLNSRGVIVRFNDEPQKSIDKCKSPVEKLINAVGEYGLEYCWNDNDIIDTLVEIGVTKEDFIKCGKYDFVKDYFESDEIDQPKSLDKVIEDVQSVQKPSLSAEQHSKSRILKEER